MCNCDCDDDEPCKCNTGSEFKKGREVYSLVYGKGIVTSIGNGVLVKHAHNQIIYTLEGRIESAGRSEIVLFHGKPTIIPPKLKVKKYKWVYKSDGLDAKISDYFSEQAWRRYNKSIGSIKLPWTEIEE